MAGFGAWGASVPRRLHIMLIPIEMKEEGEMLPRIVVS